MISSNTVFADIASEPVAQEKNIVTVDLSESKEVQNHLYRQIEAWGQKTA